MTAGQTSELAELTHTRDWSDSAVGPRDAWSLSLQTVLRLMLSSRYAMWLGWGDDLTFFYNDAYAEQTLAAKHPWALGRSAREVWKEIWPSIGPRVDHVLATGEATWDQGLLLFLERNGYPEETYHTFSYSPAPGDKGEIAGLFCVVIEETERVIGERRLKLLRDFATSVGSTNSHVEVFRSLEEVLLADAREFPFALAYLFDEDGVRLRRRSSAGIEAGHDGAPESIDLATASPWPVAKVIADGLPLLVDIPVGYEWPYGGWQGAPLHALLVPIAHRGQARPAGVFIAALNPHRPADEGARSFTELFVGQLAAALANADVYEEERRRAESLAQLDRAKTAFFSNVSHEFRTPLTLMLGPTEDAIASPERRLEGEALEIVHRNELRLLKLVNTLLDFARIEAGRVQARYEPTALGALTADLASAFRSAMERGGLSFEVDCRTLPAPIWVDRDMWEKIVLNLLSNALKFTFEGSVKVSVLPDGDGAMLVVTDTGAGVPSAELPRLFERFHRIEGTPARTHEGSGIGLALVRDLVELHGGTIDVTSTPGGGTTFRVRLPGGTAHLPAERLHDAPPPTEREPVRAESYVAEALRWLPPMSAPVSEPAVSGTPEHESLRARILVADDNADMRQYLGRLLEPHWRVDTVADGVAALGSIRANPPDLVLSDVMMPQLDGVGLTRALREDPATATIPVMLLSARAGEEAVAEGLRTGADDYLVKPFSAGTLVVRVEALLAAARSRLALAKSAAAERERLAVMIEESPAAMAVIRGDDLVVELANARILTLWGKPAEETIGRPLLEAVPLLVGQGFDELLREVMATNATHVGNEVRARLDVGGTGHLTDRFFDFAYAPLRDDRAVAVGVLVHAFDVTELVSARRVAEDANRMKDEFLATMSHELRTPLNAILGWASLLQAGGQDEATRAKALATIERNARAQSRIVDDILDVSRIVSGKLRLHLSALDVGTVIEAAVDVVRPAANAKAITLVVDVAPDVGSLNGDPDRLQQVIWNLLINAVRFTPARGEIRVAATCSNSQAVIRVTDSGVGIAPEHLPFVFERFRQVDSSTTRKHGGLGLGLAIVRHLVELHGGAVAVESKGPGQGTTFSVYLPVRAVLVSAPLDGDADAIVSPTAASAAHAARLDGLTVLVVDDDQDSRDLIESALTGAGARVSLAESAEVAFTLLKSSRPDVLVSDIGMPDEDGYALMRRVRTLPEREGGAVPAIALTAYARAEDESQAIAAGYQQHIAKPVVPGELVLAVARWARV